MPDLLGRSVRMGETSQAGFAPWCPSQKPLGGAWSHPQRAHKLTGRGDAHPLLLCISWTWNSHQNWGIDSKTLPRLHPPPSRRWETSQTLNSPLACAKRLGKLNIRITQRINHLPEALKNHGGAKGTRVSCGKSPAAAPASVSLPGCRQSMSIPPAPFPRCAQSHPQPRPEWVLPRVWQWVHPG